MALADVVVSRSSAGTSAELTALGKPSVLVPPASAAGNDQAHNAGHLQRAGAAIALPGQVRPEALQDTVDGLLADHAHRQRMADCAQGLGRPDAADRLVEVVLSAAGIRA